MFFTFLYFEIKKLVKSLLFIVPGILLIGLLLGAAAYAAGAFLYQDSVVGRINVGVVMEADNELSKTAMDTIVSMESTKSVCNFLDMDMDEGLEKLKKSELSALMIFPDQLIEGIMNGSNVPIKVIFPKDAGLESALFRQLADSGASLLNTSQAAIYAADEYLIENGDAADLAEAERILNSVYLKAALDREHVFRKKHVSAVGDISALKYFGISAAAMLMFLIGIPAAPMLKPYSRATEDKLKLAGISKPARILSKSICIFLLEVLIFLPIYLLVLNHSGTDVSSDSGLSAVLHQGSGMIAMLNRIGAPTMLIKAAAELILVLKGALVLLGVSVLIVLIYELCHDITASIMVIFFGTIVMSFMAGGIIPAVFLPQRLAEIGRYTPIAFLIEVLKTIV